MNQFSRKQVIAVILMPAASITIVVVISLSIFLMARKNGL